MKKKSATSYAKKEYPLLFTKLLDQTPALLAIIAPDGFEQSVYHGLYHASPEADYHKYRLNRVSAYKMNRLYLKATGQDSQPAYQPKLSYKQFMVNYKPPANNIHLEVLNMLGRVMGGLFSSRHYLVYDNQGLKYNLAYYNDFEQYFCTAANKSAFYKGQRFTVNAIFEKETYLNHADLSPVYTYIISLLKSWDMEVISTMPSKIIS